jgi:hypothetical protein
MRFVNLMALSLGCLMALVCGAEVMPVYRIEQVAGTYVQTTLTHDIYRYTGDAQLKNVVVTDAQGNRLPHRISEPSLAVSEQSQRIPVRFFPVAVGTTPERLLALSGASIRLDDHEISVSMVKEGKSELDAPKVPTDFFVVDISDLKTRADKVIISWPQSDRHQYLEVQVSGTQDMTSWTPITQTTLVQLLQEGELLIRNKIAVNLTERQYAFLKLHVTRGGEQLQLTQVAVENTDKVATAPNIDRWELSGTRADDRYSALPVNPASPAIPVAAWEFQRDDLAPVAQLHIDLGELTYGDYVRLFSRATEQQPWQLVHQGIWFNAQVGPDWQQSDEISGHSSRHRYWRLELNERASASANPVLVLTRQPQRLQFIANTFAPFTIAIETDPNPQDQNASTAVFSQLIAGKDIAWQSASFSRLNPSVNPFIPDSMAIGWKTILFWGILILAVGILMGFVVRLVKQMAAINQ